MTIPKNGNREVTNIRNAFQINQGGNTLTAILAIEGRLSDKAHERFEILRDHYSEKNINVKLIDETTLYEAWHDQDAPISPNKITLKLTIDDKEAALWQNKWFCAVLNIKPLLDGMQKYGSSLFDMNVRSALKGSDVNRAITETIMTRQGQKEFVHLNNGLVITCNQYKRSSDDLLITLSGAQVINGCQTLNTIWDYYCSASSEDKNLLCQNLRILAKIIENDSSDLLDKITVASNKQNPMNERNLKSNSSEQKSIQASFYRDPLPKNFRFYYVRKDGEFETFLDSNQRQPKKRDFEIEGQTKVGRKNNYRRIDNEQLAKIWWAWIGNGSQANAGNIKYFSKSIYQRIFLKKPTEAFWQECASPEHSFEADLLSDGQASPYEFLLAMAVSSFIEANVKPEGGNARFKREKIRELELKGILKEHASQQEIAEALANDNGYLAASWSSQMTFALTEVAAFLLNYHYGPLNADVCRRLINSPDIAFWLQSGMNDRLRNEPNMTEGVFLLHRLFAFMRKTIEQFFLERRNIILLENRPKLYLSKQENIIAIKKLCLKVDEQWKNYPSDFKEPGVSYFESFPKL